jgi:ribose transport system substrate-binding protein
MSHVEYISKPSSTYIAKERNMNMSRRSVLGATVLGGLALAGCTSAGSTSVGASAVAGSQPASTYMVAKKSGQLLVGFANSFAGNAYRAQMILELKEQAKKQASDVKDLIVTDANGSVDKQLSDINDLVTKGVDILMIDAASSTALNTAVERAQKAGILVVSFDNTITSTAAIAVNVDQKKFGQIGGEWLAKKLKKGDSIFTLDGASGSPVNDDRLSGATTALKAAGITIVAGAPTDWDQAKGQSATSDLLAAHPDVAGIYSQGGGPSLGAINAIEARKGKVVPISGEGYNGFLKKWKQLKDASGWESIAPSNPPSLAADALKVAVKAVRGEDPGQTVMIDLPVITQDNLEKYVRTDLPDAFFLPTSLSEETIAANYKK